MLTKTNNQAVRVPSRRSMTPAKYKALPLELRRAYDKKAKAESDAFDQKMIARQTSSNKRLVDALVSIIPLSPHIEWDIVSNYLNRNGQVLGPASLPTLKLRKKMRAGKLVKGGAQGKS